MSAQQIITDFGSLGLILLGTAFFGRWFLKRLDCEKAERADERERERGEREAMVAGFIDTTNGFNVTISNHVDHETQAIKELTTAIQHLCVFLEMPNRDYQR